MRIIYHHRTRAVDAQGIHIREMVNAFTELSHHVEVVSLVDTYAETRGAVIASVEPRWRKLLRRIPFAHEIVQLGYNLIGIPWLLWRAWRSRADLIYERYSLFNFSGVVAARLLRLPIVLEVNSPIALEQNRDAQLRAIRFATWMEKVICNAADRVIVVSEPLRRMLLGIGVAAARLVIMPNGVNLDLFRTNTETDALLRSLGLENEVIIGFSGWFKKWHGLEFLIETFRQSNLRAHNAVLLLIGDGPAMPHLQEMVRRYGMEESIKFTGVVAYKDVPSVLNVIDIAVQPAANEYCCPIKLIEYMALRKPIVAPRQENIEELVNDGQNGLLFTPADKEAFAQALMTLVCEPGTREHLAESAHATIYRRQFTWLHNAERVLSLVEPTKTDLVAVRHANENS